MATILIATAIVVLIYNLFFFHIGFGLGIGLIFLILNFYYLLLRDKQSFSTSKQNPRNLPIALFCSAISTTFAFLIGWRDSGLVIGINFLSSLFFLLSAVYFYQDKSTFHFSIPRFLLTPFSLFGSILETLFGAQSPRDNGVSSPKDHTTTKAILKGFAIALPIFLVLLLLLTQADPIFQKLTGDLFKNMGERLIFSVVIFISLFVVALTKVKERLQDEKTKMVIGKEKAYELIIILSSLALLFAAFILVQFQYLFSNINESELARLGIASLTYSEYVRKGFMELLIVSVISISVLIYNMRYLHSLVSNQKLTVQVLASVFTVETGLILLSAAQRNLLYADAHGLTRARVFGFIFLLWLAVFLTLMLIKVLIDLPKKVLFNCVLAITVLALLSFSAVNIDRLIATDFKPTVNKEIDYYYLTSISADAYPSWKGAVEEVEQLLSSMSVDGQVSEDQRRQLTWARLTLENLTHQLNVLEDKYAPDGVIVKKYQKDQIPTWVKDQRNWQSYNFSQAEAYRFVVKNKKLFSKIPEFREKIEKLTGPNSYNPAQLDRAVEAPFTQNR